MSLQTPSVDETVHRAQQRAQGYWYEDGSVDIAVAAVFLLVAALFCFEAWQPEGSALRGFSALGLPVVTIGGYYLARWIVTGLKERYTYPRTGVVNYPQPARSHGRRSFAVAGLTGFIVALAITRVDIESWLPALQGLVIGGFLMFLAHKVGIGRYSFAGVCSIGLGLLIGYLGIEPILGTGIYFGGLSLVLLGTGGLALRAYVAAIPEPARQNELGS